MEIDLSKELGQGYKLNIAEHEGSIDHWIEFEINFPGQKERIAVSGRKDGEAFVIDSIGAEEGPIGEFGEFKYKKES